jgi:hypothetical protein
MTRREELMRTVQATTARLATARQGLEDAKFLARNGMASDVGFATYVESGAFSNWLRASEAFQACMD